MKYYHYLQLEKNNSNSEYFLSTFSVLGTLSLSLLIRSTTQGGRDHCSALTDEEPGTERLGALPRATQLTSVRAEVHWSC